MNKRVIKIAHLVAIGTFLLLGAIVMAQQEERQNSNVNANGNMSRDINGNQNMNGDLNTAGRTGATGRGTRLSSADRQFMMAAAMSGLAEVELGRLAAERASRDDVRRFGQRMVDDHSRANSELTQLASAAGITLPTELDAKHRALVTRMSRLSGPAFDRAYMREMVKEHNKDVSLFQRQATRGAASDLKSFAARTLPTLREHLSMARDMEAGHRRGSMGGHTNTSNRR